MGTINGEGLTRSTWKFGTFTRSLTELKDWLLENGITHVAITRARVKKRTDHGNKQAKTTLMEASWAVSHTKNTFYNARYHRLAARRGKKRVAVAVVHSILKSLYHVLKDDVPYREPGSDYLDSRMEAKHKKYLKQELEK